MTIRDTNPRVGVKLPNAGRRVVRTILRPEGVVSISGRLEEPYATLVLFLAATGLRVGEAIAVKCDRRYVGDSSISVTENIYDHAGREDFRSALGEISDELFRDVSKLAVVN